LELKNNILVLHYITFEWAKCIWDKLPHHPNFWGLYQMPTFTQFFKRLQDSSRIIVFPGGLILFTEATPGVSANAHALFLTRKAYLDFPKYASVLANIANKVWGFKIIATIIPESARSLRRMIEATGFTFQATMSEYFQFGPHKDWTNGLMYTTIIDNGGK
jgi:hypothetical protein